MKSMTNSEKRNTLYPQKGITKRVVSGSFITILGEGIVALKHIFLVPLFLWTWGELVYGEWLTLYALVAYLPLVDIGMKDYVVNRLTQCYSRGNLKEYTKILHSSLRLYLTLVVLLSTILAMLVFYAPFSRWLNINITGESTLKITVFIIGTYFLSRIPLGLIYGLYHSFGEFSRRAVLINIQEIFLFVFLVLVLFLKGNFILVSAVQFIPILILGSFVLWDIKRRHSEIRFGFSSADWRLALSFVKPGSLFFIITLANILKIQGSILIISAFLGSSAVVVFAVHRTLAHLILKIVIAIKGAIWPELTAIEARQDYKKMQFIHNFLIKLSLFISFSCVCFLFFTGKGIIRIWTQGKIPFQPMLWIAVLIYLPFNCLWEISSVFQVSINKHKKFSLCRIVSAILGLILAIILTNIWGIMGTFIGFIIPEVLICVWIVPHETLKIIKTDKIDFWTNTVGKVVIIFFLQLLIGGGLSYYKLPCCIYWILLILGIFFVGGIVSYLFWLNDEERKRSSQIIRKLLINRLAAKKN